MAVKKATIEKTEHTFLKKITAKDIESIGRQVWFASIGVCGKGYDELTDQYQKTTESGQQLFNNLVARGEEVQVSAEQVMNRGRVAIERNLEKAKASLPKPSIGKTRVKKTRVPFLGDVIEKIDGISEKIDQLAEDIKQ